MNAAQRFKAELSYGFGGRRRAEALETATELNGLLQW